MRTIKRIRKLKAALHFILTNKLPIFPTLCRVIWDYLFRHVSISVMAYTPYLRCPGFPITGAETYLSNQEYVHRAINLNDLSLRPLVRDKMNLFTRLGTWMGRAALDMSGASDEQINTFLQQNGTVVGKQNSASGRGFHVYATENGDSAETIRADRPELLEAYINQHPTYREIYPESINTLRIHTVRNSHTIRLFFMPKLRVGADGSKLDLPTKGFSYRVLLDEKGRIVQAFLHKPGRKGYDKLTEKHHNTGYAFTPGKTLPYIPEAIALCMKAALRLPEIRYIGWDVAITPQGPIVVEANDVSGIWSTYQSAKERMTRIGNRAEAEEMFSFATEGVEYWEQEVFVSRPLVEARPEFPSLRQLYLIFLQTALHRHGVEFREREYESYEQIPPRHDAVLTCDSESDAVTIAMDGKTAVVPLPFSREELFMGAEPESSSERLSEDEFFRLDRRAMHHAALIYQKMILGCEARPSQEGLAAYARFCCRLHTAYLWGATGEPISPALLQRVRMACSDHESHRKLAAYSSLCDSNVYAFDCGGLIRSYYCGGLGAQNYDTGRDENGEMLYRQALRKGSLSALPEEAGLCLYAKGHVGIYVGNGMVVEASADHGTFGGVHQLALSERPWEAWFEYDMDGSS